MAHGQIAISSWGRGSGPHPSPLSLLIGHPTQLPASSHEPPLELSKREKNDSEGNFEIKCKLFEIRDSPHHFDLGAILKGRPQNFVIFTPSLHVRKVWCFTGTINTGGRIYQPPLPREDIIYG